MEGRGLHGFEGAAARALLARVRHFSRRVNRSVDDEDDVAGELLFEVLDHLAADLLVELKGAEGDLDHDVLGGRAIISLERLLAHRVNVERAKLSRDVLVGILKDDERLSSVLFELGGLDLLQRNSRSVCVGVGR